MTFRDLVWMVVGMFAMFGIVAFNDLSWRSWKERMRNSITSTDQKGE